MASCESGPFPVTVHPFESPTPRTCAYEMGSPSSRNALVFIGGLGDGPHTVPYVRTVAHRLGAAAGLDYSVFEVRMASAFAGYGYNSLKSDVLDLSGLAKYLRGLGRQKIVFLGHSTGCQDCMEYADRAGYDNEPVDAFILQAPCSDREAIGLVSTKEQIAASLAAASDMIEAGREDAVMPRDKLPPSAMFSTPITAYRWNSLVAPGGDDDFFSADLSDATLASFWGRFQEPVLVTFSGADEFIPETTDMGRTLERWRSLAPPGIISGLSGVIPGASHAIEEPEARLWMADRVVRFLESLEE